MRAVSDLKQTKDDQDISESGLVSSGQEGVHPHLDAIVRKHLQTHWSQPLHLPTTDSWRRLELQEAFSPGQPFILDSGCGTGESTRRLADRFPSHLVIGVDRSLKRLAKGGVSSALFCRDNYILLRAELATFWRLLLMRRVFTRETFSVLSQPLAKTRSPIAALARTSRFSRASRAGW